MTPERIGRAEAEPALVLEQIRLLIHSNVDLLVNLFNASVVAAVLWPLYPGWLLVAWLGLFGLIILVRLRIRRHFRVAAPGARTVAHWGLLFAANAFATGCMWGLTGTVILVTPNPTYQQFIVFVLGGMMAGGMVSNSAYLPAMVAFMVPAILPVAVFMMGHGDALHVVMGAMLVAYTAVLFYTGRKINYSIIDNFRLRFAQQTLASSMAASQAALAEAQALARVGSWDIDLATNVNTWSTEQYRLLGLDPATAASTLEQFLARVHPDDRAAVDQSHARWLTSGTDLDGEFRLLMPNGAITWVHELGLATRDAQGQIQRLRGTLQDVSERRLATDALAHRDRLLRAVTTGTGFLVKADSLDEGIARALQVLGESLQVDRVLMIQEFPDQQVPYQLYHAWEAPGNHPQIHPQDFRVAAVDNDAMAEWREQLAAGRPVISHLATSSGPVRALLERLHNQSTLLVPIFAGGRLWGNLGVDACTSAREWTRNEIETLGTFAGIVGRVIFRDQERLLLEQSEQRYRVLSTTAQDAIISIDAAGLISTWNLAAERTFGYTAAEAIGRQVHEFLAPARYREQADPALKIFATTGTGSAVGKTTELAARRKDGTEIAIELSLSGARLGGRWEAIGILRDISARKQAAASLEFANLLLKTQSEASLDGILIVDANLKIISFNQRFADIWNIPRVELVAGNDSLVLAKVATTVKDQQSFLMRVQHLYAHPDENGMDELQTTDDRFIERYSVGLRTAGAAYLGRAWFFRDVTARKTAEAQAVRMARFDILTGLANRSVFVEALQHGIAAMKRGGRGVAVLYLDLDHFKDVNDTLGHPAGDELLKAVAERLRSSTRATDTIARFGGDEFALAVTDCQDPADAAILAEKLIKALSVHFHILGSDIHTSASIGIATYGPAEQDAETLLSHADVALYRAKAEGRGDYRFFTDAMDAEVKTRVMLGTELREAVDSGQLFLMYQPQVETETGSISGVEALVRWRHPLRGVLGPDLFIPIAEQIGIIAKLGHWVLWAACEQAAAWLHAGIAPVRMAVNVSALQFRTPLALQADIAAALAQTGLPPRLLEIELTESVLMDASREHSTVLQSLRATGVTIAIDDFGVGYSSLDYLRRFPADRIKIAQTFVMNLDAAPENASIVKATIGLARELGIRVIAEGVETQKQSDTLRTWGCTQIQGFYYARPLSVEDATAVLRTGSIVRPVLAAA